MKHGRNRRNIYIALENMNFYWTHNELVSAIDLWNNGCSIPFMSKKIKRTEDEIGLMIISVSLKFKIFFQRDHDSLLNTNSVKDLPPSYYTNVKRFLNTFKNGYLLFSESAVDFIWDEDKVLEFERLWNQGMNITDIKERLKRKTLVDIVAIAIDRCQKEHIKPRRNGLEGIVYGHSVKRSSKPNKNRTA